MKYIADFHVHSRYSRATAKNLDLEHLYIAAQIKGITVVGTGDFTHPAWYSEISEKLVPAEPGLYRLKDDLARICDHEVPESCKAPVRFILTAEISNIYKKDGKTRKNHNLLFLPDIDGVKRLNTRLDAIGNIRSDGRPILGLDARILLEILLEQNPEGFLVPAHIWTPWFSLLGSKSGFDSLEECFEDLSSEIFAAETGLSSDPAMNRRLSGLDRLTLMSNSDAHSPANLGREANLFDAELSYPAIRNALKSGNPELFPGTFEFYPDQGKYHLDGHRKCGICLDPQESMKHRGLCPECGKPLTLGVLYRVEELADRKSNECPPSPYMDCHLIPLADLLSDIFKVGSKTARVGMAYENAIRQLGPEFRILHELSYDSLNASAIPLFAETIVRMRDGRVNIAPGYDGEFGKVEVFSESERKELLGQKALFHEPARSMKKTGEIKKVLPSRPGNDGTKQAIDTLLKKISNISIRDSRASISEPDLSAGSIIPDPLERPKLHNEAEGIRPHGKDPVTGLNPLESKDILSRLNAEQQAAVLHGSDPLLISAGPGTGKTRTITHKIAHLIGREKISPQAILAVTFTNKAAMEMKDRLRLLLPAAGLLPEVNTFHGFCYDLLCRLSRQNNEPAPVLLDDADQNSMISMAIEAAGFSKADGVSPEKVKSAIMTAKQNLLGPEDASSGFQSDKPEIKTVYGKYQELLHLHRLMDFEDLICRAVLLLENPLPAFGGGIYYSHIFVDEYQDLNHGQYRIIKALSPEGKNLCVIGDPDQSIYGFRGSDPIYFKAFMSDFPYAKKITLNRNYRSTETILNGSLQIIRPQQADGEEQRLYSGIQGISTLGVIRSATDKSEAVSIGKLIEKMVGGLGFHSMDFGRMEAGFPSRERSFSDFAILYRTRAQGRVLAEGLDKASIPYQIACKTTILEEPGIRELISLFRLVEGSGTMMDMERVGRLPGSGIGSSIRDAFKKWILQNHLPIDQALMHIRRLPVKALSTPAQSKLDCFARKIFRLREKLEGFGAGKKLDLLAQVEMINDLFLLHPQSLERLSNLTASANGPEVQFLSDLILKNDVDFYDGNVEKVTLMTLHASKGLEFPVVFICGCEKGLIPFAPAPEASPDEAEERRLFYVAMTRAREALFFSWAAKRSIYGKTWLRSISPFVEEIESRLLRNETGSSRGKKQTGPSQMSLF